MGAVNFSVTQLPMPSFGFHGPRVSPAADTPQEEGSVPDSDVAATVPPSSQQLTDTDWGTYSLETLGLTASSLSFQSSDNGTQVSLQASQLEVDALAMTLRSDDGLIEFSLSSLTMRASQLSLSFAQDQRAERAQKFMHNMNGLAKGIGAPHGSRLAVSAEALSLRFTSSAIISETALNGFENGATKLAGFDSKVFTEFLVLFRTLLASSDQEASEFLEALNDFLEEMFGVASEEVEGDVQADVDAALASNVPEVPEGENSGSIQALFEQIEIRYTRVEVSIENGQQDKADPLVLDLDDDGVELTDAANAQQFDIYGNGTPVAVQMPTGGDAFLAIDRNGNGRIDGGKELFGDQHGAMNGFAELAKFDTNLDGVIDVSDMIYEQLLLFGDLDNDGTVRPDEFTSLSDAGIAAINLGYSQVAQALGGGNEIVQSSQFVRDDGSTGHAADILLRTFSVLA